MFDFEKTLMIYDYDIKTMLLKMWFDLIMLSIISNEIGRLVSLTK